MGKTVNTAEKTIVDADKIAKALQENSTKQLRNIMQEAIMNLVREEEEKDMSDDSEEKNSTSKEAEDNSYDVEDVNATEDGTGADSDEGSNAGAAEGDNANDGDDTDDEWSDMDSYKVGDTDYDFTGADGETILKVYSKLGDDDEIVVTKDEDGNLKGTSEETGTEYVIELNPEGEDADAETGDFGDDMEFDLEIGGDNDEDENGISLDLNGEDDDDTEFELSLDDDDDEEELNEENLGYTTTYQKDVFKGGLRLGSNKAKNTNDWDKGAPDGSSRPYGKRGSDAPYTENVNECGTMECGDANMEETMTLRKSYKTKRVHKPSEGHRDYVDTGSQLNETKVRRIYEAAKQIQAENKEYKKAVDKIKKSLYEAAVLNANMGKIINLFVNETTTKEEKIEILDSFNNAKTVKEGERLYESYHMKLNGNTQKTAVMERTISMNDKTLNETTIYTQKHPSLDLMERMNNLYKK